MTLTPVSGIDRGSCLSRPILTGSMDRRYTEMQILTIRSKPHTTRPRPIAAPRMGPCERTA